MFFGGSKNDLVTWIQFSAIMVYFHLCGHYHWYSRPETPTPLDLVSALDPSKKLVYLRRNVHQYIFRQKIRCMFLE